MAAEIVVHPSAKYNPRIMAHDLLEVADDLQMVMAVLVRKDGTFFVACAGNPKYSDMAFAGSMLQDEAMQGSRYSREDFED